MPTKALPSLLLLLVILYPVLTYAAAIDATNHYAWNDNGGWVNWDPTNGNVSVTSTALTGYIWSADFGWINLSPTNGGVTNNGQGVLGGYAWGQSTGWINFTGVTIDSNGVFHGSTVAQSVFGTMTFDCTNCLVQTEWRPSSSSSGGSNGPIVSSGPLSVGYQTPTLASSSSQTAAVTTAAPASLVPSTPPPSIEPKTKPSKSLSQPSQLAAGITIAISAPSSAAVGTPLPVSVSIKSSTPRSKPIAISYQLYPASGIVAYAESGKMAPNEPLQFVRSIPTGSLMPDDYVLAVTAAYGTLPSVTQTIHVRVVGSPTASTTPTSATAYTDQQQCALWFGQCAWQSLVHFFTNLFAF